MPSLTKALVLGAKPKSSRYELNDTKTPGLCLRVYPSGRKVFMCRIGRSRRKTLGRADVLTVARARKLALDVLAEDQNNDGKPKPITLRRFLDQHYGPWLRANRKSGEATLARIESCFGEYLDRNISDLSPWLIEKWRKQRREQGRAVSTTNRDLGALKSALSRAVDWELLDQHPLARVKPHKVDKQGVVRYLSSAEEKRLRKALDAREVRIRGERASANEWRRERGYELLPELSGFVDHIKPLVLLALNTGLRRGELFDLEWADVNFRQKQLTVRGVGAKSGQTRHIPLNAEALELMRNWQGQAVGQLVFPSPVTGGRLNNLKRAWKKLMADAGIVDFRLHDLRHSFASKLVMRGVDLYVVKKLLGHASIEVTQRYAHLAPDHLADAVKVLDEMP